MPRHYTHQYKPFEKALAIKTQAAVNAQQVLHRRTASSHYASTAYPIASRDVMVKTLLEVTYLTATHANTNLQQKYSCSAANYMLDCSLISPLLAITMIVTSCCRHACNSSDPRKRNNRHSNTRAGLLNRVES